jgi:hypothetical protein
MVYINIIQEREFSYMKFKNLETMFNINNYETNAWKRYHLNDCPWSSFN